MRFTVAMREPASTRDRTASLPRGGDGKPQRPRGGQRRDVARQGLDNAVLPSRGPRPGTALETAPLWTLEGYPSRQRGLRMRVRSRGLPRNRGRDRKCGIMTQAIRRPLVVHGAGERSAKNLLTSPGFTRPDCSPLWGAVAHLAYKYSKKVHTVFRYTGDCPRARAELCLRCSWLGSSRACVARGDRTIMLWLHRKCGRSVCQPFSLDAMDRTPRI